MCKLYIKIHYLYLFLRKYIIIEKFKLFCVNVFKDAFDCVGDKMCELTDKPRRMVQRAVDTGIDCVGSICELAQNPWIAVDAIKKSIQGDIIELVREGSYISITKQGDDLRGQLKKAVKNDFYGTSRCVLHSIHYEDPNISLDTFVDLDECMEKLRSSSSYFVDLQTCFMDFRAYIEMQDVLQDAKIYKKNEEKCIPMGKIFEDSFKPFDFDTQEFLSLQDIDARRLTIGKKALNIILEGKTPIPDQNPDSILDQASA